MSMREMCVEAAARALANSPLAEGVSDQHIALLATEAATSALDAILAVLAEPTPEMEGLAVASLTGLGWDEVERQDARGVWQAMLKAIR